MTQRVLVSWSSGKDSAWSLHRLRSDAGVEVVGLLTAFTAGGERVSVHGVPRRCVEAQAEAAGLPLVDVIVPERCPNDVYESAMRAVLAGARARGATHVAFGDLFLEDIRAYRRKLLQGTGLEPLFPAWCGEQGTAALAERMLAGGLRAFLTCVDTTQLDGGYAGRAFDAALLRELPANVDPCAERGEFHTFCTDGPAFSRAVKAVPGARRDEGRFAFAEVVAAD